MTFIACPVARSASTSRSRTVNSGEASGDAAGANGSGTSGGHRDAARRTAWASGAHGAAVSSAPASSAAVAPLSGVGVGRMVDDLGVGQPAHDLARRAEFVAQRQLRLDHHEVGPQPQRLAQQGVGVVDHPDEIEFEGEHRTHRRRNAFPVGRHDDFCLSGRFHVTPPRY